MAGINPHQSPLQDAVSSHFASATRYGERWHQTLYPALQQEPQASASTVLFYNRYAPLEDFQHATTSPQNLEIKGLHFPSAADDIQADNLACYAWNHKSSNIPTPPKTSNGLLPFIDIDTTSALAIHLLQVLPGDIVLDFHGANGNEAIATAQSIWPHLQPSSPTPPLAGAKKGAVHIMPSDDTTREELERHLRDSLPAGLAATGELKVLAPVGSDTGSTRKIPFGPGGYDKVLLRAPTQAKEEKSAIQPASNSPEPSAHQLQALLRALHAVRIGGKVLYTTSSIAREDNDGVVESAISWAEKAKQHDATAWTAEVEVFGTEVEEQLEAGWAERTGKGWIVLPDHGSGRQLGPRFCSVLTKRRD